MKKLLIIFIALLVWNLLPGCAQKVFTGQNREIGISSGRFLHDDDAINKYCLKVAYPQIREIARVPEEIILWSGKRVPYDDNRQGTSVRESLISIYPLEPVRSIADISPGRKRPYELFNAIYGETPGEAGSRLSTVSVGKGKVSLNRDAARAFTGVVPELEKIAASSPESARLLIPEGGYNWRKIAGENALSTHAYGIAIDLGARYAPYWRWNKLMPHPMQRTYPEAIVAALEKEGFIWGGKWREYDLMHFEYRPELICKSAILRMLGD